MDVYEPGPGAQIADMNPSTFKPVPPQLFWTLPFAAADIDVHLGRGSASVEVSNYPIIDYPDIVNALAGPGVGTRGSISYKVKWSGVDQRVNIRNTDRTFGGFAGEFVRNAAQIEWTAHAGDHVFVSDPLATSKSDFAEIGHERNGVFFPQG